MTHRCPTLADLNYISANLFPSDLQEVHDCVGGLDPLTVLFLSCCKTECWVFEIDGTVVAIGGRSGITDTAAEGWILATQAARRIPLRFLRAFRRMLDVLLEGFQELHGRMLTYNNHNHRLAKLSGVRISNPVIMDGKPFYRTVYTHG